MCFCWGGGGREGRGIYSIAEFEKDTFYTTLFSDLVKNVENARSSLTGKKKFLLKKIQIKKKQK